jgi:hypothetical protein
MCYAVTLDFTLYYINILFFSRLLREMTLGLEKLLKVSSTYHSTLPSITKRCALNEPFLSSPQPNISLASSLLLVKTKLFMNFSESNSEFNHLTAPLERCSRHPSILSISATRLQLLALGSSVIKTSGASQYLLQSRAISSSPCLPHFYSIRYPQLLSGNFFAIAASIPTRIKFNFNNTHGSIRDYTNQL